MVLTFSSFKDLSTVELLQNLCCYFGYKRKKILGINLIFVTHILAITFRIFCSNDQSFLSDIIYVYERMEIVDENFYPGARIQRKKFLQ